MPVQMTVNGQAVTIDGGFFLGYVATLVHGRVRHLGGAVYDCGGARPQAGGRTNVRLRLQLVVRRLWR